LFEAFITKGLASYFILSSSEEQRKLNVYNKLVYSFYIKLLIEKF